MNRPGYPLSSENRHRLDDKVVLVTGAAGGIGRGVAKRCTLEGATVILLDKQEKQLNSTYDDIIALGQAEPVMVVDDLASLEPTRSELLAGQIDAAFGRLDGLLHFAADSVQLTPLVHTSLERWQSVVNTNLNAAFELTRALFPLLSGTTQGTVVFSSGNAARRRQAYYGATGVSWGALDCLAETWTEETADNEVVRFFSLDPGAVNTPMRTRIYPGEDPANPCSVDDISDAYVHLLSTQDKDLPVRLSIRQGVLQADNC